MIGRKPDSRKFLASFIAVLPSVAMLAIRKGFEKQALMVVSEELMRLLDELQAWHGTRSP